MLDRAAKWSPRDNIEPNLSSASRPLKRPSQIPSRPAILRARPRHISEMNSAHVDPNLGGTRIYCERSAVVEKSCWIGNAHTDTAQYIRACVPVINAVLMAPRFQFHARPTRTTTPASRALFRTIPIVIRSAVNFARRASSVSARSAERKTSPPPPLYHWRSFCI